MTLTDVGLELDLEIRLRPSAAGGRRTPIVTGYRPLSIMRRDDGGEVVVGLSELALPSRIRPGTNGCGTLRFHKDVADLVRELVHDGSTFDLAEGRRVIGTAIVSTVRPAR